MTVVIRVVQLEGPSQSTENVNGQWLKSFDVEAFDGGGDAVFTNDIKEAIHFPGMMQAFAAWKTQSKTRPFRPDGKPNRPLTAFTITFDTVA